MDNRGFGSGYSSWGGGGSGNRGSGGFDLYGGGHKDSMSGLGGYGGGGHMKRGLSGSSLLSSTGTHADAVIAKINQRLDMLSQLEGGFKGSRADRFDQFESYDSRPSGLTSPRDLYRSGSSSYGCGDGRGDNGMFGQRGSSGFGGGMGQGGGGGGSGFDSPSSSYGVAKMRQSVRESFGSGQGGGAGAGGWLAAGRRSPRRGGGALGRGAFASHRPEPTPLGGGGRGGGVVGGQSHRGHAPGGGRGKLPSLLSNRMYPESVAFHQGSIQGPHDFPGRHFGGGPRAGRQRGRKRPLNKQVKPQHDVPKKRNNSESEEPESKVMKTEVTGSEEVQEKNGDDHGVKMEPVETKPVADAEPAPAAQVEKNSPPAKQAAQSQDKHPKMRKRRGFLERVMFACSVCKFRSFYKEEMETHLESRFHKDHFKFLSTQLSKPTTDFLEKYLLNKFRRTEQRVGQLENHSAAICQMYKEQDLTRDLGMEHFMRKMEAAHCAACDVFIPMQPHLIQKHMKSPDHNYNRKGMMEQSKKASLSVARSILNHKLIGKKLESYLKGENPFCGTADDQDPEECMAMEATEHDVAAEASSSQAEEGPSVKAEEELQAGSDASAAAAAEAADEKAQEQPEAEGDQVKREEEEGFEVGEGEEDFVVHDEIGDEALPEEEEQEQEEQEGVEATEVKEEEEEQQSV